MVASEARSVLKDVCAYLLTMDELSFSARQLFAGRERNPVDPAVTLYPGAMGAGMQTHDQARPAVEVLELQLICRSQDYEEAETFSNRIYEALYAHEPPYPYETIWPMHPPQTLSEPDPNARFEWGFPIRAQRTGG